MGLFDFIKESVSKLSRKKGEPMRFEIGEGLEKEDKEKAEETVQRQIRLQREEPPVPFLAKPPKEKIAFAVTAPVRWTAGSLTRLLTNYGLEKAQSDIEIEPQNFVQKLAIGEEPIRRLSKESLTYGFTEETLKKAGVPEPLTKKPALYSSLIVGAFVENPFLAGLGTGAKKVFRKSVQEMVEKETGQQLKGEALKKLNKQADEIFVKKARREEKHLDVKNLVKEYKAPVKPVRKDAPGVRVSRRVKQPLTKEQDTFLKGLKKDVETGISKKVAKRKIQKPIEFKMAREARKSEVKLEQAVRKTELKMGREIVKVRSSKRKIVEGLKNRAKDIAEVKKDIYKFTKETLPLEKRGKLNAKITSAVNRTDLSSAFRQVINERNDLLKKESVSNIQKTVDELDKLSVPYQDKIVKELDSVAFKGITPKKQEELMKLKGFLERQPEARFLFGAKTRKKMMDIAGLKRKNIKTMPIKEVFDLEKRVQKLAQEGRLAQKTISESKQLKREIALDKIKKESNNIDKALPRTIAKKQTWKEKAVDKKYQIAQDMQDGYMNYVSTDIGFEILDNNVRKGINYRTFKKPFDDAFFDYKEMNSKIVNNYFDYKKSLEKKYGEKLEKHNLERIMIHATKMQEGGRDKLVKSGVDEALVDDVVLSAHEQEMYSYMREVFDELRPFVDETLQSAHGRKLGKVDNYFSWQTDYDNADEVFQRLEDDYLQTSRTAQGFTKSRTVAGRQVVKLNAEDVFLKHVNDSSYFIHAEELLNNLGKIARDETYRKSVGKSGQKWVAGWIDLMARKGIPKDYMPKWYSQILRNIGAGILGFRLSPIVKQPLAKITSSALLGRHAFTHDADFFAKGLGEYVRKVSKQQKFRSFDDPAFTELAKNKKLAKWQEAGYAGIKWMDSHVADSVWYGAYRKYFADNKLKFNLADFKKGTVNKDALEYADYVTRRTQGSGEAKDLARMLTSDKKDVFKAILQFQSFVLNESYLIPHDAIAKAFKKEKNVGKALGIMLAVMATGVAEDYVSSGIAQLFSHEKYAEQERKKEFWKRFTDAALNKIPFLNNVYGQIKYDRVGVPIIDIWQTGVGGAKSMITAKSDEAKTRGLSRLIESLGEIIGVAGIGQAAQIFRKFGIKEEKSRKVPGMKKKKKKVPGLRASKRRKAPGVK